MSLRPSLDPILNGLPVQLNAIVDRGAMVDRVKLLWQNLFNVRARIGSLPEDPTR